MWNLIPQVFYDLYARVIPGALLLASTILVFFEPEKAINILFTPVEGKLFAVGFFLLWLLISYFCGFVINQLSELTIGVLTKKRDKVVEKNKQAKCLLEHNGLLRSLGQPVLTIKAEELPQAYRMREHIRHVAPDEAARLLKVRAEWRMCQVLFLGFILLMIPNTIFLIMQYGISRIILEIFLIILSIICWYASIRLHVLLINGTTISWLNFISAGKLPLKWSQSTIVA